MRPEQLNPYIRFYHRRTGVWGYTKRICAFDHRLFFLIKGWVIFEFSTEEIRLNAGDLIIIPPGFPYLLKTDAPQEAVYFLLNFDFCGGKENEPVLRSHVEEKYFDPREIFSRESFPPFDTMVFQRHCEDLFPWMENLEQAQRGEEPERDLLSSAFLKIVLTKIMERNRSPKVEESETLRAVKRYIHDHVEENLTNIQVAKEFGYHPYYLSRLFLENQGMTLHRFIVIARLEKTKELLSYSEQPIADIAQEMGFPDSSCFSAFFKKHAGMTPKQYRQLIR